MDDNSENHQNKYDTREKLDCEEKFHPENTRVSSNKINRQYTDSVQTSTSNNKHHLNDCISIEAVGDGYKTTHSSTDDVCTHISINKQTSNARCQVDESIMGSNGTIEYVNYLYDTEPEDEDPSMKCSQTKPESRENNSSKCEHKQLAYAEDHSKEKGILGDNKRNVKCKKGSQHVEKEKHENSSEISNSCLDEFGVKKQIIKDLLYNNKKNNCGSFQSKMKEQPNGYTERNASMEAMRFRNYVIDEYDIADMNDRKNEVEEKMALSQKLFEEIARFKSTAKLISSDKAFQRFIDALDAITGVLKENLDLFNSMKALAYENILTFFKSNSLVDSSKQRDVGFDKETNQDQNRYQNLGNPCQLLGVLTYDQAGQTNQLQLLRNLQEEYDGGLAIVCKYKKTNGIFEISGSRCSNQKLQAILMKSKHADKLIPNTCSYNGMLNIEQSDKKSFLEVNIQLYVVTPDLFEEAMRVTGVDVVELSSVNMFPTNIRMFIRFPVLKGSQLHELEEKRSGLKKE